MSCYLKGWKNFQALAASSPMTAARACHSLPPRPWVVVTPTSKQAAARMMYSSLLQAEAGDSIQAHPYISHLMVLKSEKCNLQTSLEVGNPCLQEHISKAFECAKDCPPWPSAKMPVMLQEPLQVSVLGRASQISEGPHFYTTSGIWARSAGARADLVCV